MSGVKIRGVYETVLYAGDVGVAVEFYRDVVGLTLLDADVASAAFRVHAAALLLVFDPRRSSATGRGIPAHGADGPGHLAFSVDPGSLSAVARRLADCGVAIEHEELWPAGGRSLYVRDPAGNSIEFIDGQAWP